MLKREDFGSLEVPGESGFSLVELMTAIAVSLVTSVSLVAFIPVFVKAQASTASSDQAAATVRVAMLALQHDIEEANPLDQFSPTVTDYDNELQVTVGPTTGTQIVVTWLYTPPSGSSPGTLTRQSGSATPTLEVTGVDNGSTPVFAYFGQNGENLVTQLSSTGATVANCSVLVQVTLAVKNVHAAPDASTESVQIQDRTPGQVACG